MKTWYKLAATFLLITIVFSLSACINDQSQNGQDLSIEKPKYDNDRNEDKTIDDESLVIDFTGYQVIDVDGGDLSGHREASVAVEIGFGDREYWAFTNEYGQLVKVIAHEIILQNDNVEPVTSSGRYYVDEAKVPGTEAPDLDEGHVIADSLGGVANAYNITPQNSVVNRHGDQAYMEESIRKAGGCTDFVAKITYPNTITQIPSYYDFTYKIKGVVINDTFPNTDPELENNETSKDQVGDEQRRVQITKLDKKAEFIEITNISGNFDLFLFLKENTVKS